MDPSTSTAPRRPGSEAPTGDGRVVGRLVVAALLTAVLLAAVFSASVLREPGVHAAKETAPLILLISIDTLRADHLGCYGYPRPTSPNLDRLAAGAVLFEQAFSHAPSTLVSHASLFTSTLPQHHGASHRYRRALPGSALALAEILSMQGRHTLSINGGGQMADGFGIAQGFDVYRSLRRDEDNFDRVVDEALEQLDAVDGPTFMFLHTYEVHSPLTPPSDILALFRQPTDEPLEPAWTIDRYDAEIRSMDRAFGRLEAELRSRDLWDAAWVVLTSDHGEELGERGRLGEHAHSLHDELLHVPLLIKAPGQTQGERRTAPVRLIDVAPTILAMAGAVPPDTFDGVDLLATDARPGPLVAHRDTATVEPVEAWRNHRWKWIAGRLFDLDADPGETRDVAADHAEQAREIEQRLARRLAARSTDAGEPVTVSDEVESQLKALGYAAPGR